MRPSTQQAKPRASRVHLLKTRLTSPMHHHVSRGHQVHRNHHRYQQPSDNRPRQRRIRLGAGPQLRGHRNQAQHRRERRHQNWPQPQPRRHRDRLPHRFPFLPQVTREFHNQDAVRHHDPHHHHHAHQRHHVQRRPRRQKKEQHPRNSRRHRQQNNERVLPRRELRHQHQIHQHHRKNQPDPEALERLPHALHRSAQRHTYSFRELRLFHNIF